MADRLRVGILCEGPVFKHWQAECIRQVLAVKGVEAVLVIVHDRKSEVHRKPSMKHALYRWFKRKHLHAKALLPDHLDAELSGVPRLSCRPTGPSMGQRFTPEDLAAIKGYAPDLLLRFGFGVLLGDILGIAPHGIWSYHHGDEEKYRGRPAAFWEIVRGDPVTGVTLQRLTEQLDAGRILRKGWFRTTDRSWSDNLDNVMLGSTGWMAQVCRELLLGHTDAAQGVPSLSQAPLLEAPGNWDLLTSLLTRRIGSARRPAHRGAEHDEWNIGVLYQPISALLEAKPSLNVRWLPSPSPGQQRKSPFGYMADGQLNVLYGKYDSTTGKGDISRLRPKRDNVLKRSRTMLSSEHVLSYPFLLQHEGRLFVIPESSAGRVDLYEVNHNNEGLEFIQTLLDEPLCSPTVFQHDGMWWLMGTKAPWEDVALHAYYAPALNGPWMAHAQNPLKMDVRSARPAGTPFVHDGRLYRPALDNSHTLGWRVALMRVIDLSPTDFREELVRTIGPVRGSAWSHGTGIVSAVGDLILVDGKRAVTAGAAASVDGRRGSRTEKQRAPAAERDDEDDED